MPELFLATNNQGKQHEILALLGDLNIKLITPASLGLKLDPEESGQTYRENAAIKARAFAAASGLLTLADDSGLEVDALNGFPGVHSARIAPTVEERRAALIARLAGKPRPWTARFRCVAALAAPLNDAHPHEPQIVFTEGICEGEIIPTARGVGGFGYDPIFQLAGRPETMAELTLQEKNRLSHRARAVLAARPIIIEMLWG
ncbi:MAG TPA: RdgB/HAM1 family non-canonical purine NTP pyrophosphatase [Anaerolineales bacterium]|nr:RdgB/HAM1 family non-canonical purine NTP pyrophosphatase [Anaerolineales bacterium]